jgi:xanthine dehydrogenase accessory factor
MKSLYSGLDRRLEQKAPLALATIIEAEGSTPQIAGASALFSKEGLLCGTLGGGVIEADAQEKAVRCLIERKSLYYEFELQGDISASEGAICGGSVSILIDASPLDHLEAFKRLKKSLLSRQAGILISKVRITPSGDASISRHWLGEKPPHEDAAEKDLSSVAEEIEEVRLEWKPKLIRKKEREETGVLFFFEPLSPLFRLVIAGAGHIGQAVAHLGSLLDFEVTVIDDRVEFANPERFPQTDAMIVADIGRALADFPVSSDTYVVIVTRGHSYDAEALRACIQSSAAYIGMIGSRRKVSLMREKFVSEGWATAAQFDRVHAPIGLEIGSKTVEEIAVSIAAELVRVRSHVGEKKAGGHK